MTPGGSVRGRTADRADGPGAGRPPPDPRFVELCAEPALWSVLAVATEPVSRYEIAARSGIGGAALEVILEIALLHGIVSEHWSRGGPTGGRAVETALDGRGLTAVASALAEGGGDGEMDDVSEERWAAIWYRLDRAD